MTEKRWAGWMDIVSKALVRREEPSVKKEQILTNIDVDILESLRIMFGPVQLDNGQVELVDAESEERTASNLDETEAVAFALLDGLRLLSQVPDRKGRPRRHCGAE